ncbi:MAG: hypothetical protein EA425_18490 [Puniceicoccaceae bacterium]|nr:MAG: hypothetical protein EA425_18490 [Puniceicoccaceae bacterium]
MKRVHLKVGPEKGDLVGSDHRVLQAAVDYVARLGGGTVEVLPGVYDLRNSVHLRSRVTLRGHGEQTVLRKTAAAQSPLHLDGDFGEMEITLEEPEGFLPGDGVTVSDRAHPGFHTLVATILWRRDRTFGLDQAMRGDYLVQRGARAATAFPAISGVDLTEVALEDLTIDGNKAENPHLDGCRGGGIYLLRSDRAVIRRCTVRDFHGDGISFQLSASVVVEDCVCRGNTHFGLHPGSGSTRPVIRGCLAEGNGEVGLFVCWRVKHGRFEENTLRANGRTGISLGHKDTDNLFRRNQVLGNGREGVLFRAELEPMGAHRNRFEDNVILDNGSGEAGVGIEISDTTHDLDFHGNRVGNAETRRQRIGVRIGAACRDIRLTDNDLEGNRDAAIEDLRPESGT